MNSEKITIGVQGITGKTGHFLAQVINEFTDACISHVLVKDASGATQGSSNERVAVTREGLGALPTQPKVWIDFSTPASAVLLAAHASRMKTPLLIATTGFSPDQKEQIRKYAETTPILVAGNTSLGVFAQAELSALAIKLLGDGFDIEISEIHHNQKKDAPSGTALFLADTVIKAKPELKTINDRTMLHEPRKKDELGMSVIRGGSVYGEHTVYFIGNGERLEITHRVWDRQIFARGAIVLARRLIPKKAGLYTISKEFFDL